MAQIDFGDVKKVFAKKTQIKNRKLLLIILGIITAVITFIAVYFGLMPINFASGGFRFYLVLIALLWCVPLLFKKKTEVKRPKVISGWGVPLMISGVLILLFIILSICVSPLFMAKNYRELINVEDNGSFIENVENYDTMQIPVVDKDLANKLGDKKLGEDNYGSQFEIDDYTMITYNNTLYWIAPIEYSGFFQWTSRPASPGYVLINATNQADVKIVKEELPYVESAYFWDDLNRKIYFENMFRFREGKPHLELDDAGKPMYVDAVLQKNFAFTSGTDSVGVIITDAKSGKSEYYSTEDVPSWVDRIQPAAIIEDQLGFWGNYVHGFWNSVFAKKDVLEVSSGINYVYSNGHMYLQTGMTSIGSDESIVGVSMVDMRTKQSVFLRVGGATEFAAAQSAQGVEQAQGFVATDPIIINFNGIPTYFMMLKDREGLVKRYAYVNVLDYRLVATNINKDEALAAYEMLVTPDKVAENITLKIADISANIVIDGKTYYYIKFVRPDGNTTLPEEFEELIFKAPFALSDSLAFIKAGDTVNVDFVISVENIITKLTVV